MAQTGSTFDDILISLGEFGKYQKILFTLCSLPFVMTSMQLLNWVFIGAIPNHECDCNGTVCQIYDYDDEDDEMDSVVMEWNLLCDRSEYRAAIGAAPMFGYLFGGLIFGYVSDRYGRKPAFLLSHSLLLLSGFGTALSPDFYSFLISRVLTGVAIGGIDPSCFLMGLEFVGPSKRTLAGVLSWFFESAGLLLTVTLAVLCRPLRNWRFLQILYTIPGIGLLTYLWIIPESARWLMGRGRIEEVKTILRKAAKVNKVTVKFDPEILDRLYDTSTDESSSPTFIDLFKLPHTRIKTLILNWMWIVTSSLYYVLLLDQSEISDNLYLGFLITVAVQIPGYFYVIFTLERPTFGRKKSVAGFLFLAGTTLVTHPFVTERYYIKIILSVIGRFASNCAYTVLNLYSAELYPTTIRGIGTGFSMMISRIGTILAPYVLLLADFYAPSVFFGIAALTAGIVSMFLPETLGRPLPETLDDGEKRRVECPCVK